MASATPAGVEFEDVEVKRAAGGLPESLASTLAAFASARGCVVILGLDERQGFAATGVEDAAAMRDAVAQIAAMALAHSGPVHLRDSSVIIAV